MMLISKKFVCHGKNTDTWLDKNYIKDSIDRFTEIKEWCEVQFGKPPVQWEVVHSNEPLGDLNTKIGRSIHSAFSFMSQDVNYIKFKNEESYMLYKLRFE